MENKNVNRFRNCSKMLLAVLCMVYMFCLADKYTANAASKNLDVLPTDVSTASDGCIFVEIEGKYTAQIQDALDRVNEIRKEACREGVPDPSDPDRKLSTADYVPVQWSSSMEYIARIRAAESVVHLGERPNGKLFSSLKAPDGASSDEELLVGASSMLKGINEWYEQKKDWVNQNPDAMADDYAAMINPENKYIGLGGFVSEFGSWRSIVAGEFCTQDSSGSDVSASTGRCIQTIEVKKDSLKGLQIFQQSENVSEGLILGAGHKAALTTKVKVVIDDDTSFCNYPGSIAWTSSNPSIAQIDSKGVVTVKKSGNAVITASDGNGRSASCKIFNALKGTSLTSLKGGKGSITLGWKRQKQADGYVIEMVYGKNSFNQQSVKTTVDGNQNTKYLADNLRRKSTYCIRIRTYRKTGGKIIYSDWSKGKTIRTK